MQGARRNSTCARYVALDKPYEYDNSTEKICVVQKTKSDGTIAMGMRQWLLNLTRTNTLQLLQVWVYTDRPKILLVDNGGVSTRLLPWGIKRCWILRQNSSAIGFNHVPVLGNNTVMSPHSTLRRIILEFQVVLEVI